MPTILRLTCPVSIGRQGQFDVLRHQLDLASAGSGRVVVLEAEAGLGKSRLVADLAGHARDRRVDVIIGRCFESERGIAFAPFTDLLATYLHEHDAQAASDVAPELGLFAPDGFPDMASTGQRAIADDRFRHERILRGISMFVARLAGERPVLLVIEDLHWIDDASLAALDSLARRLESLSVLMLLTCRDEDAPPRVRHVLAALHRAGLATVIELEPLTFADTMTFVKAMFDLPKGPGSAFVHALHALTGGNPFFMEEVLGALVASGDIFQSDGTWERKALDDLTIPRLIQDAVAMRLVGLDAKAKRMLEIASVLGQRVETALLLDLSGGDEQQQLDALRALVDAGIVVEESADELSFRHDLIRQSVEAGMLRRERRAIHRAAMEAMASTGAADARAGKLARHAHEAEAWEESLAYAADAGKQALSMGAPLAAIGHFDLALNAAERRSAVPPWGVVHGRAKALDTIGDFEAARVDYERAERIGRETGSVRDEWEAALDLGFLWCSRNYAEARPHLERALEIARASGEDALVAHSLNRIGNWLANANEPEAGLKHHRKALDIFRQVGDRRGEAQALDMASMAHTIGGDLVAAARLNRDVIALFRELGDQIGEAGNIGPDLPNILYDMVTFVGEGTVHGMREHAARAISLARGASWISGEAYATTLLGASTFVSGDLGRGLDVVRNASELAFSIDHQEWMVLSSWGLANLLMEVGQFQEAVSLLERARELAHAIHNQSWIVNTTASLAMASVRQGRLSDASDLLGPPGDVQQITNQGECLNWLASAEFFLADGRSRQARDIVDRLYATAKNLSNEGDLPILALIKVPALLQAQRPEQALGLVDAALGTTLKQGARTTETQLRMLRVHALDVLGRREEALQERDAAVERIGKMAGTLPEDARDAYVSWALGSLPLGYRQERPPGRAGGLTRRESEVAGLVATGLTNRQIGERLFIAERTVESHVSAIMRKLEFSARTQIAAWSVDRDQRGT